MYQPRYYILYYDGIVACDHSVYYRYEADPPVYIRECVSMCLPYKHL